jgi:hypothetical protein
MPDLQLISPAIVDALYGVLDGAGDKPIPTSRLQWAAGNVCRDAHARAYSVERMLVEVKPEWSTLLDSLHFPRGPERTEITNRFIAFCINEYFLSKSAGQDGNFARGDSIAASVNEASRSDQS